VNSTYQVVVEDITITRRSSFLAAFSDLLVSWQVLGASVEMCPKLQSFIDHYFLKITTTVSKQL